MMMNDPTVLEASRVLAEKLMAENSSVEDKMKKAWHRIICRVASAKEAAILKAYYEDQLQQFKQKQLNAATTLKAGEYPSNDKLDANATAALMKVINMIYNMEEAIIKT
jgi:hypothetical protein